MSTPESYAVAGYIYRSGTAESTDIMNTPGFSFKTGGNNNSEGASQVILTGEYFNKRTKLDYIPFASILLNLPHTFVLLLHTITHLSCAIFDAKNRSKHLKYSFKGFKICCRTFTASIPLIGNAALYTYDKTVIHSGSKKIRADIEEDRLAYRNLYMIYKHGRVVRSEKDTTINSYLISRGMPITMNNITYALKEIGQKGLRSC